MVQRVWTRAISIATLVSEEAVQAALRGRLLQGGRGTDERCSPQRFASPMFSGHREDSYQECRSSPARPAP